MGQPVVYAICAMVCYGLTATYNHIVAFGDDRAWLVLPRRRHTLNQIEQAVASRRNVRAVLQAIRRPLVLGSLVVALVEKRVEGFKNQRLVCFFG
jgi:hypothetical protein